MNKVIHSISDRRKWLLAIFTLILSLGPHARAAETVVPYMIELTNAHNARSDNYYSGRSTILGVAPQGAKAKVIETEFDENGHKSYHAVIQSGRLKGRTVWLAGTGIRKIAEIAELDTDSSTGGLYKKSETHSTESSAKVEWGPHSNSKNLSALSERALGNYGQNLLNSTPSDVKNFCPQYSTFNSNERLGFWSQLLSGIVKFESGYKAENSYVEKGMGFDRYTGSRVTSAGLLQLSYQDQATYKRAVPHGVCDLTANHGQALYDASVNLNCGVAILNYQMGRNASIAGQSGGRWVGGSSYWAVLRTSNTRSQIQKMTRNYCKSVSNAVSGESRSSPIKPTSSRRTVVVR